MFGLFKRKNIKDDNIIRLTPNIQGDLTAFELVNLPGLMILSSSSQSFVVGNDEWDNIKEKMSKHRKTFLNRKWMNMSIVVLSDMVF